MFNEQFKNNFKRLRQRSGLSQKSVAEKIGNLSPQSVSKWERGEALPNIEYLPMLAEAFFCEIGEFFVSCPDESEREEMTVDKIIEALTVYESTPEGERKGNKECYCAIHLLARFEQSIFSVYGVDRRYFEGFFRVNDGRIDVLLEKMEKHEMLIRFGDSYVFHRITFIVELTRIFG